MPLCTAIVFASWAWGDPIYGGWMVLAVVIDSALAYVSDDDDAKPDKPAQEGK